jgi:hypothetical protein
VGTIKDELGQVWNMAEGVGGAFVHYFTRIFSKGPVSDFTPYIQPLKCCVFSLYECKIGETIRGKGGYNNLFPNRASQSAGSGWAERLLFSKKLVFDGE